MQIYSNPILIANLNERPVKELVMKILSFAATNSQQSINKRLVSHATRLLADRLDATADVNIIDLNDYDMPIYSQDRENASGIPAEAHRFFHQIRESDVVLISFAEHNGSFTAAFKNLFDWASRIDKQVFNHKPMLLMATSPGGRGGQNVLKSAVELLPHFGADVRGSFSLPAFHKNFNTETGEFTHTEHRTELTHLLESLLSNPSADAQPRLEVSS